MNPYIYTLLMVTVVIFVGYCVYRLIEIVGQSLRAIRLNLEKMAEKLKSDIADITKKSTAKNTNEAEPPNDVPAFLNVSAFEVPAILGSDATLDDKQMLFAGNISEFVIKIHNPEKKEPVLPSIRIVEITPHLEGIRPDLRTIGRLFVEPIKSKNENTTKRVGLSSLEFQFDGSSRLLMAGQCKQVKIFKAVRRMGETTIEFLSPWNSFLKNQFVVQGVYFFSIEVSGTGIKAITHQFIITFNDKPKGPIFSVKYEGCGFLKPHAD